MGPNIKKIREAVLKNRGGLAMASDTEIMTIWRSLDGATQNKYLESVKGKTDAISTGPKSGVSGSSGV